MKNIAFLLFLFLAFSLNTKAQITIFPENPSDFARIYKAMDKGRNGEDIKVGVIGGSITQGFFATTEDKRWSNLMADWWEEKFPDSNVELINAGWGGTGSDIGTHRVYDDLLVEHPDFIVVEFAVNDVEGDLAKKMMEGLIQQSLLAENTPGIMILTLKQDNGTTAQASHKEVAEYYKVPMVSFADLIDAHVVADNINLSSIFVDGLHPNDVGMAYMANFIKIGLDSIYATLPDAEKLPEIKLELPTPLVTNIFSSTFQFFPKNIVPLHNQGWTKTETGWYAESVESQIDFKLMGNAVSVIFTQNNKSNRGKAEVWVDEGEKTVIDAYMFDDWGTKYAYALVQEGLADGEHVLHIKVLNETNTSGNYVHIERIMVAGNVGSAAPIAITSKFQKGVVNYKMEFDGTESFDPDGDEMEAYEWSIIEKPNGSTATINNANEVHADFTPDVAGDYIINLIVKAGINSSIPASKKVSIRAINNKPIAIPGNDTVSALNKYFRFNGTQSYDADGDALLYSWVLESSPDGSDTYLQLPNSNKPQCKFDINGNYVVSLVVFDSIDYSEKSFMTVEGREGYTIIKAIPNNLNWVSIFPNPVCDILTIQYFLQYPELITLNVFTMQGIKMFEQVISSNNTGVNIYTINIEDLNASSGVFLLRLSGATYTKTVCATII